jgi:hypothetical protein
MGEPLSLWYLISGLAILVAVLVALPLLLTGALFYFLLRKYSIIQTIPKEPPMKTAEDIRYKILIAADEHCSTSKKQELMKDPKLVRVDIRDWDRCWDREGYQLDKALPVLVIQIEQSIAYQIEKYLQEMIDTELPLLPVKDHKHHREETHDGVSWHDYDNAYFQYKFSWKG